MPSEHHCSAAGTLPGCRRDAAGSLRGPGDVVGGAGYGAPVRQEPSGPDALVVPPDVEVRRSRRRTRTVTAFREGGRLVVAIPDRFTRRQEREWVRRMVSRLESQEVRRKPSDEGLAARATELSRQYLGGQAVPTSVAWSSRQGRRWGSCSTADGSIRISARLRGMPSWVLDYVLLHELAHLLSGGHGPEFWALLGGYPRTERARGFLDGFAFASDVAPGDQAAPDVDDGAEDGLQPDECPDEGPQPGQATTTPDVAGPTRPEQPERAAGRLF